jgi:hypothetical protein
VAARRQNETLLTPVVRLSGQWAAWPTLESRGGIEHHPDLRSFGGRLESSVFGRQRMTYTWDELHKKPVAQLRKIAEEMGDHDELHGFLTMHKEDLLPKLCKVLGIEDHAHHNVVGIDKAKMKSQIRALKVKRDEALASGDRETMLDSRQKIKRLKRKIRRATV